MFLILSNHVIYSMKYGRLQFGEKALTPPAAEIRVSVYLVTIIKRHTQ